MSGKTTTKPESSSHSDRRIARTRNALGDALIQLMQAQPFESITVQQVLEHAGVSRSTFYAHYRDKDDLFLSDVEEFLELIGTLLTRSGAPASRLFPVEELFSHIAEVPGVSEAINASGKGPDVRDRVLRAIDREAADSCRCADATSRTARDGTRALRVTVLLA
jgi:AcrR family transcriptional regulator